MRNYLGFDIEIAKELPDGGDWESYRPLGITCAALHCPKLESEPETGSHTFFSDEQLGLGLTPSESTSLVHTLLDAVIDCGYTLVTWNGLGFDFDILAEESGMWKECRALALDHVDMMFQAYCLLGYPVGLDIVAKTMGLKGKLEGVSSAKAPALWAAGEYKTVLDYIAQDALTTYQVAVQGEASKGIRWVSKKGNPQQLKLPDGWLTVRECLNLPKVDNSWMDKPILREEFTAWLNVEA